MVGCAYHRSRIVFKVTMNRDEYIAEFERLLREDNMIFKDDHVDDIYYNLIRVGWKAYENLHQADHSKQTLKV